MRVVALLRQRALARQAAANEDAASLSSLFADGRGASRGKKRAADTPDSAQALQDSNLLPIPRTPCQEAPALLDLEQGGEEEDSEGDEPIAKKAQALIREQQKQPGPASAEAMDVEAEGAPPKKTK